MSTIKFALVAKYGQPIAEKSSQEHFGCCTPVERRPDLAPVSIPRRGRS
jgi:hypothetical protein